MDTITRFPVEHTFACDILRRPALPGFLARHVLREHGPLVFGSRKHLVATCRAELAWAVADWKRINPHWSGFASEAELIALAHRLPHEAAAALVVNCNSHLLIVEDRMRALLQRIPGQRRNASREDQSAEFRASWQITLDGSLSDLTEYRGTLRRALSAYRKNAAEYRALRHQIDAPTGAPCMRRIAA